MLFQDIEPLFRMGYPITNISEGTYTLFLTSGGEINSDQVRSMVAEETSEFFDFDKFPNIKLMYSIMYLDLNRRLMIPGYQMNTKEYSIDQWGVPIVGKGIEDFSKWVEGGKLYYELTNESMTILKSDQKMMQVRLQDDSIKTMPCTLAFHQGFRLVGTILN